MLDAAPGGTFQVGVGRDVKQRRCCPPCNTCSTSNGTIRATAATNIVSNTTYRFSTSGVEDGGAYGDADAAKYTRRQRIVRPATGHAYGVDVRAAASDYGGDIIGVLHRGVCRAAD